MVLAVRTGVPALPLSLSISSLLDGVLLGVLSIPLAAPPLPRGVAVRWIELKDTFLNGDSSTWHTFLGVWLALQFFEGVVIKFKAGSSEKEFKRRLGLSPPGAWSLSLGIFGSAANCTAVSSSSNDSRLRFLGKIWENMFLLLLAPQLTSPVSLYKIKWLCENWKHEIENMNDQLFN